MATLFVTAGATAQELAERYAGRLGSPELILRVCAGPLGPTLREQEAAAVRLVDGVRPWVTPQSPDEVVLVVETGTTGGALLVLLEAASLAWPRARKGAVVVSGTASDPDAHVLGPVLWELAADGRLSWSLVTDGGELPLSSKPSATSRHEVPSRRFGSRLYGE